MVYRKEKWGKGDDRKGKRKMAVKREMRRR